MPYQDSCTHGELHRKRHRMPIFQDWNMGIKAYHAEQDVQNTFKPVTTGSLYHGILL